MFIYYAYIVYAYIFENQIYIQKKLLYYTVIFINYYDKNYTILENSNYYISSNLTPYRFRKITSIMMYFS